MGFVINFKFIKLVEGVKLLNREDKLSNFSICVGRIEANYIATNPLIFEDFKLGDKLICMKKDDFFRMQDDIIELYSKIIKLLTIVIDLYSGNPELLTDLRIKQLKNYLN